MYDMYMTFLDYMMMMMCVCRPDWTGPDRQLTSVLHVCLYCMCSDWTGPAAHLRFVSVQPQLRRDDQRQ